MAAAAGILNHHTTAAQAFAGRTASPMAAAASGAGSSNSSDSAGSDSATISANDFLTLLVTEMKNQDPTADTDPNEYINQLVNVNSLEQLISINQTLTTDLGSPIPSAASVVPAAQASGASAQPQTAHAGGGLAPAQSPSPPGSASVAGAIAAASAKFAPGNLNIPAALPAAQIVARSLSGRPRAQ
ncbi:MAG: flagellar hook capping FlgD N-terminal domain-containing protein [Terracidiphilus sp.]